MKEKDVIEKTLFETRYHEFIDSVHKIHNNGQNNFMDSIIHYCDINSVDIESVASLVNRNPKLKETIREEAQELHFMSKTAKLPL